MAPQTAAPQTVAVHSVATRSFTLLVVALMLGATGCHLRPDPGPPGSIGAQRSRFVLNDPYPRDDLGPPIVGGRPLGFDLPPGEAVNSQIAPSSGYHRNKPGFLQRLQQYHLQSYGPGYQGQPIPGQGYPGY